MSDASTRRNYVEPDQITVWGRSAAKGAKRKMLAVYLGLGYDPRIAARRVGTTEKAVRDLLTDPEFVLLVEKVADDHTTVMAELLQNSEAMAVQTMMELLDSESDDVRLKAAQDLLNRSGKRGPVISKVETKNLEFKGDLNEALLAAIADPGVRALFGIQAPTELPIIAAANDEGERSEPSEECGAAVDGPDYELLPSAGPGEASGSVLEVQPATDLPGVVDSDGGVQRPDAG